MVEDNDKLPASLKKRLEQEGYAVDFAPDGAEAQVLIETAGDGHDAVLLDRMLPGGDGMTLCSSLRSLVRTDCIPGYSL